MVFEVVDVEGIVGRYTGSDGNIIGCRCRKLETTMSTIGVG